jgi:flagellar capping protein FliD
MDIDERLEALTQSVESIASMQKDAEQRLKENEERAEKRMAKLEGYMATMMQSITRLSNVTAVHTIQIDDHEKRIAGLDQ